MSSSRFRLTKWYLDVVSGAGEVFVGHVGWVAWRGLSVSHAALLVRSADGATLERRASRVVGQPVEDERGVAWRSARLGVDGTWVAKEAGSRHRLLETEEGAVDWTCLAPVAKVEVEVGSNRIAGRGYAERLDLTIRPWRLPIDELRWGRFAAEGASLVWIEWRGPRPLSLALLDGKVATVERIDDERVALRDPEAILSLTPLATLREGRLGAAVLDRIPGLRGTLPARMLAVHESRRLSSGLLEVGNARHEGDALHEVIRWP